MRTVQDSSLIAIADAIRGKTGETGGLSFPTEFVSEIGTLTNTSDGTATNDDIRMGKTAYVNGEKVYGFARMFDDIKMTETDVSLYQYFESPVTFSGDETKTYTVTHVVPSGALLKASNSYPIYEDGGQSHSTDATFSTNFTFGSSVTHTNATTVKVTFTIKNKNKKTSATLFPNATSQLPGWLKQVVKYYVPD